jgi:chemotaxis protein methyltransferase CheR
MPTERQIELPEDVFHLIRDLVHRYCGVVLEESAKFFVENRLQTAVRKSRFDNFRDYYYFLRYDPRRDEELAYLIDQLTVHETYFFREELQLQAFAQEILPELAAKKTDKALRIWSAGCSTGEEPYTIAMLLLEQPEFRDWKIEIFASDVSQRVLQVARRGVYGSTSFRTTQQYFIQKYFHKEADGLRIADAVKQNIVFLHLNLVDDTRLAFINPMDVIFCRNVVIYFDLATKKRVVELFHKKLRADGYLLLGHSESLINISNAFALRHFKHDMVYQKVEGAK